MSDPHADPNRRPSPEKRAASELGATSGKAGEAAQVGGVSAVTLTALAERIYWAISPQVCEETEAHAQARADRRKIYDFYKTIRARNILPHDAETEACVSWLRSVLTEALGGEGRGGEQKP
jgi:hypothetical protein